MGGDHGGSQPRARRSAGSDEPGSEGELPRLGAGTSPDDYLLAGGPHDEADVVAAVRRMPGDASRRALHVLAGDLLAAADTGAVGNPAATEPVDAEPVDAEPVDAEPDLAGPDLAGPAARGAAQHGARPVRQGEPGENAPSGPSSGSLLGEIVDVVVGARRLAAWSLWLQLAALAHLISRWQSNPPIVPDAFPAPADPASPPGLADRLWRLVDELEIWGTLDTADLAEAFVASEIAAASGLSHYSSGQLVDAARTLFMTTRLPRTRRLLRAGLLDHTKLRTVLTATRDLDDAVCALVEAHVIADADLAVAEPLDTLADPLHPGAPLPPIARMNNPSLQAALHAAIAAVDADASRRRSVKERQRRAVHAHPLPDGIGRLEITTGQEQISAILTGLDHAAATAKRHGDPRSPDQIRCDHAVHLLTGGAFGADAYPRQAAATAHDDHPADTGADRGAGRDPYGNAGEGAGRGGDGDAGGGDPGRACSCGGRGRRRQGLQVRLTIPLSTWLDLTDDPAVLDGYGAVPAAIARQIAADAARNHPTTTTWRCVVVGDTHRTVLGVGDLIPTPRHDPTTRQATYMRTAEPYCVFPGCRVRAQRCDLDHRIPYDHDRPGRGGPTCTCNLQPLCRRHHRLRTAGLISPRSMDHARGPGDHHDSATHDSATHDSATHDGERPTSAAAADEHELPAGSVRWTTITGRSYEHQPPPATPAPADPAVVAACAAVDARRRIEVQARPFDETYDENTAQSHWEHLQQRHRDREATRATRRQGAVATIDLPEEPTF